MKLILFSLFLFSPFFFFAQDSLTKKNALKINYSVGLQSFGMRSIETITNELIEANMPAQGYYNFEDFGPIVMQKFSIETTPFKNKSWLIGAYLSWSKDEINSSGFSADTNANPVRIIGKAEYSFGAIGWGIKKQWKINKSIGLSTWLNFYSKSTETVIKSETEVIDRETGERIFFSFNGGSGGLSGNTREGFLMLLDNPQVGFTANLRIFDFLFLNIDYSYWLVNGMVNDLYGLSKKYLIPFKNSKSVVPLKQRDFAFDNYSHGIYIGLLLNIGFK